MENEEKMEVVETSSEEESSLETEVVEENEDTVEEEQETLEPNKQEEEPEKIENEESLEEFEEVKKQTKEEDSKFAQIRRKAEAEAERKIELAKKEAFEKGRLESFKGKLNPYTDTVINDLEDLQVYEEMSNLAAEGKDPIKDYVSYISDKRKQEKKEAFEHEQAQLKAQQDLKEFEEKHPDVDITELLKDEQFTDYCEGKTKSLVDMYESFTKFKSSFRTEAMDVAKKTIAAAKASPGALGGGAEVTIDYNNMSKEDFNRQLEMVKDGELK